MKNNILMVGAAALAFAAPVLAQPGKGGGNGGGNGGGGPAKVERGGGGGQPQARGGGGGGQQQARGGGGPQREMRGGGGDQQRAERGNGGGQQVRGADRRVERQQARPDRGPARDVRQQRDVREQRDVRQARDFRDNGGGRNRDARVNDVRVVDQRGQGRIDRRVAARNVSYDPPAYYGSDRFNLVTSPAFRTTGLINGCPPGLAAKGNGCLPPGQAKRLVGAVAPAVLGSALLPPLYRSWYPDNDDYYYRTSDGYVYRIDRDRNYVDAYWPLADDWDGAYYVGAAYPQDYLGYYNVPVQYQPWYADNNDYYYRYGDGAIYQVDRQGGLIEGIVSLLAGGFGVGQPLPAGYDVYNVPYAYRDRYVDTPDSWYRYNDGYIYQVDPTTQIVQAIVETLV